VGQQLADVVRAERMAWRRGAVPMTRRSPRRTPGPCFSMLRERGEVGEGLLVGGVVDEP
jgi:hypothetical protein